MKKTALSDVWLKASILGANWAASEIILGSFLHNLHIPFKGNILTTIGLILMISVSYIWKDKGLFWRTGLICALMKTMSPSAVIFGPMVAIFMEALLLEISVRLLGRNLAGFFLGSALAMSWILFQKIINYIIFYGFNIVEIYADLLKYAERQLDITFDVFWMPVLILLGIYILFGLFAVFGGMRIGRSIAGDRNQPMLKVTPGSVDLRNSTRKSFDYSISWLLFSFIGLISTLILITNSPVYVWMPVSATLVTVWILRYKRAMRQLSRPKFWISFVIITILSALLISSLNDSPDRWLDGLMVGLQMNFRAAVVIVGFSVLSTELYNPIIRSFLARSAFKQVPAALEIAFQSLPFIVANLPDAKTFLRKPGSVIRLLISYAENSFIEQSGDRQAHVIIVSGDIAEGKTSLLVNLAQSLKKRSVAVGGLLSSRIIENEETVGYKLVSVETGEEHNYLRLKKVKESEGIGRFNINHSAIDWGRQLLSSNNTLDKDVVIIDEVGKLELEKNGWRNSLEKLLTIHGLNIVISVRKRYVQAIVEDFNLTDFKV
jgi:nucleoside-triphosphatase THEP1